MKQKSTGFFLFYLHIIIAALYISACEAPAVPAETATVERVDHSAEQQELIFLLQYIGRDYQLAVADGEVISDFEYEEMRAFSHRVIDLYAPFQQEGDENMILFEMEQLRQMIHAKEDRFAIWEISKTLVNNLATQFNLKTFPNQTPDVLRGKQLYEASGCAACHGQKGAGDGFAAEWLDPGPGDFTDIEGMKEASPYLFYNVIQFGVIGTGMPSFQEALSPQEVWDIAFYLMTLRSDFNPSAQSPRLTISLEALSSICDVDLIENIQSKQAEGEGLQKETELSNAIDYLRQYPGKTK